MNEGIKTTAVKRRDQSSYPDFKAVTLTSKQMIDAVVLSVPERQGSGRLASAAASGAPSV